MPLKDDVPNMFCDDSPISRELAERGYENLKKLNDKKISVSDAFSELLELVGPDDKRWDVMSNAISRLQKGLENSRRVQSDYSKEDIRRESTSKPLDRRNDFSRAPCSG